LRLKITPHPENEAGMFNASQVVAAVVVSTALASLDTYAITVDFNAGANGTLLSNQSFNETRAADVTVLSPLDLNVASMTLRQFNVVPGAGAGGTLGARIYDSNAQTLLASSNAPVGTGFDQSLTVPIAATLVAGHTYRVGFFLDVGGLAGSGDLTDVNPAGLGFTPYTENTGLLQIAGTFQLVTDSFPANTNSGLPFISLEVTQVPEPSVWMSLAVALVMLVMVRHRGVMR
jgi:hypothetical protein